MRCVGFLLLSAILCFSPAAAQENRSAAAAQLIPQQVPLPDVRNQPLTDALRMLQAAGLNNVRVARQHMDDMPAGVVLWQYPLPNPQPVAVVTVPTFTEIVLIVVEPFPVLPDLRDWRADHALQLIGALGLSGGVADVAADVSRSIVTGQSRGAGPVPPADTVSLNVGPMRIERETVVRVDTVYTPVRETTGFPLYVVGLITLGALGAGALAASTLFRKPPLANDPGTTSPEQNKDSSRPDGLDMRAFDPVVIDEAVWVTHGTALTKEPAP